MLRFFNVALNLFIYTVNIISVQQQGHRPVQHSVPLT